MRDLKMFASDVRQFCRGLNGHHSIEDAYIFPKLAKKLNIAHLEKHHNQLHKILDEFDALGVKLRDVKSLEDYDAEATLRLVKAVNDLVLEHEAAEELMLQPDLLKQHFNEREMQDLV